MQNAQELGIANSLRVVLDSKLTQGDQIRSSDLRESDAPEIYYIHFPSHTFQQGENRIMKSQRVQSGHGRKRDDPAGILDFFLYMEIVRGNRRSLHWKPLKIADQGNAPHEGSALGSECASPVSVCPVYFLHTASLCCDSIVKVLPMTMLHL